MKKLIKKLIEKVLLKLPPKNVILFESAPLFSDNTKAVFDEMVRRGLNKKYKLIWGMRDEDIVPVTDIENVKFIRFNDRAFWYYSLRAKVKISCNRFLISDNNRQFSFYLGHGNPLKNTKNYYVFPNEINYFLSTSLGMKQIRHQFYGYSLDKMVVLGYPRNDILTEKPINIHRLFKSDFNKIIVWYPTFRQGKIQRHGQNHAIPVIWDEEKALEINEYAKEKGVIIVLKPHFAQDVSHIKKLDLSNIVFIDDKFFKDNNITSYRFVGSCDALLTDFSSIYYDYTLCDKPIGLIWEDYEEYKQNPGFAVDMDYMMKGGVKIYDLEDFKAFIKDVADGVDRLQTERREIRDFANISTDGKNSERVVDFIIEKAKL